MVAEEDPLKVVAEEDHPLEVVAEEDPPRSGGGRGTPPEVVVGEDQLGSTAMQAGGMP